MPKIFSIWARTRWIEAFQAPSLAGVLLYGLHLSQGVRLITSNTINLGASLLLPQGGKYLRIPIERTCRGVPVPGITSPCRAVMVLASGSQLVLFDPNDVFDSAMVDAGPVNAPDKCHSFVPVGTLETLSKIDPEVLAVRPRKRGTVDDFHGLDTLSASGTRGIVAGVPEPYLGTGVAFDNVDTVEALHDQVYARLPSALSAQGTPR